MAIETLQSQCVLCNLKSGCFNVLSNPELDAVSESKLKIKYKKGETIRKQGSFTKGLLYISKGLAKEYKEMDHIDQNCIVTFYKPGQMIGLSSLFISKTAQYTVVAMTDCTVCCIEVGVFQGLMNENNDFALNIIKNINSRNDVLFNFQISNNHKQLHGRLAEALLFLRDDVFENDEFDVNLSRRDLAEYTNMSTMSVVRILKSFKEDGLIEDQSGLISILNVEKLAKISRIG